jgi:hypothetical protein
MAISIGWATRVITVPQADLTHISGTLYELDVDVFRLALGDLEDSDTGMAYPVAHRHNPEVVLAGVTYARSVEIINGYTVTFEDGSYRVRLAGANNNIGDVANLNSVSILVQNSAGLINAGASALWDAARAEHAVAGTFGEALDATVSSRLASGTPLDLTPAAIDAIWDELTAEARTGGSYGQLLKDMLDVAISTRAVPGSAMALVVDAVDNLAVATSGAQELADGYLDRASAVEGYTPRQLFRLIAAVLLGKSSGLDTSTGRYRDLADTKDRVVANIDQYGNRTSVSRNAT